MSELTPDRLAKLRRIAEAATPGPYEVVGLTGYGGPYALRMPHRSGRTWYGVEGIKRREDAEYFVAMNRNTVLALLDEIERLRRERDAALDVLGREDIGDGAKVEGVRLILKGGDRGWPTRESERVVDNEIERLRKEREVMAEVLKAVHERDRHIHTCDHCECALCPEGAELSYRAYRAVSKSQLLAGEEGVDGVTHFALYHPDFNWWECQACRFLWEFENGNPYDDDMRFCPRCGRRIVGPVNS